MMVPRNDPPNDPTLSNRMARRIAVLEAELGGMRAINEMLLNLGCPLSEADDDAEPMDHSERRVLDESWRRWEFMAGVSRDMISCIGRDLRYKSANAAYLHGTGKTRNELVGRTPAEVWGEEAFARWIEPSLTRCLAGEIVQYEARFPFFEDRSGSYRVTYYPYVNLAGKVTHAVVTTSRLTELRELEARAESSEALYRDLVETSPDLVLRLAPDCTILFANEAARTLTGRTPEELVGTNCFDLVHPGDRQRIEKVRERACAEFAPRATLEARITRADGALRLCRFDIHLHYKGNDHSWCNAVVRDVSDEKELANMRERAEQIMRHDVKSPAVAIISAVRLIKEEGHVLSPPVTEYLDYIQRAANKIHRTMDTSMQLLGTAQGLSSLEKKPCDLMGLLQNIEPELAGLCRTGRIRIRTTTNGRPIAPGDVCLSAGDPYWLETMLANLVRNACEASPLGATVSVDFVCDQRRNRIVIHNQGEVDPAIRDRLFDPYVTAGKASGTGLGTYSARVIARAHGGDITFESSAEKGTTFTLTLPCR